jgi:6-phosphogluconolactonase
MTSYKLTIIESPEKLAQQAAQVLAAQIDLVLASRDRAQIALAGGTTPAATYRLLGEEHLPWERVDVWLGDERWVAADDPASNLGLLKTSLLASPLAAGVNLHPVPTDLASPALGAAAYGQQIMHLCVGSPPRLDLVLLGLGDDGHTASLFPGTNATTVTHEWVTVSEGKGMARITMTAPLLSAARKVVFLVSGSTKREALRRLLDPEESPQRTPARLVQPDTDVIVLADQAAAGDIGPW